MTSILVVFDIVESFGLGERVLLFGFREVDGGSAYLFRRTDNDRHMIINKEINNECVISVVNIFFILQKAH